MTRKEDLYKALASKNRLRLIVCLAKKKCVSDMLTHCELSQSALSQHLKVLKDAGIVTCEREGKMQVYSVSHKKFLKVAEALLALDK